jgi:hypothetical protein
MFFHTIRLGLEITGGVNKIPQTHSAIHPVVSCTVTTIDCGLILIALFAIIVYPKDFTPTQESTGRKFLDLCLKDF